MLILISIHIIVFLNNLILKVLKHGVLKCLKDISYEQVTLGNGIKFNFLNSYVTKLNNKYSLSPKKNVSCYK